MSFSHQLLYHIMTILKSCTENSFELVVDLTQATSINEPDVSVPTNISDFIIILILYSWSCW